MIVVILDPMYPRTVKVRSSSGTVNEYVRVVEPTEKTVRSNNVSSPISVARTS